MALAPSGYATASAATPGCPTALAARRAVGGVRREQVDPDDDENVEDSPEEILARLVRYRDSLNREASSPVVYAPRKTVLRLRTAGREEIGRGGTSTLGTELLPAPVRAPKDAAEPSWRRTRSAVAGTVLGQFLAVLGCAVVVVAFEQLETTIAVGLLVAAAAAGLIAAWRRIPLALWWTAGVVIGGVLGRWS
jgi:hypothetical protein